MKGFEKALSHITKVCRWFAWILSYAQEEGRCKKKKKISNCCKFLEEFIFEYKNSLNIISNIVTGLPLKLCLILFFFFDTFDEKKECNLLPSTTYYLILNKMVWKKINTKIHKIENRDNNNLRFKLNLDVGFERVFLAAKLYQKGKTLSD